jgi:Ca2+-binding EF-hand superfamily protein
MSKLNLQSPEEQRELFLWKFKDVSRTDINERLAEFKRFDFGNKGELEEDQALMLLEYRGETKTFLELRAMVSDMDSDGNHRISFLEWCCALYQKNYAELDDFVDEEARQAALASAKV